MSSRRRLSSLTTVPSIIFEVDEDDVTDDKDDDDGDNAHKWKSSRLMIHDQRNAVLSRNDNVHSISSSSSSSSSTITISSIGSDCSVSTFLSGKQGTEEIVSWMKRVHRSIHKYGPSHCRTGRIWNQIGNQLVRLQKYEHAIIAYDNSMACEPHPPANSRWSRSPYSPSKDYAYYHDDLTAAYRNQAVVFSIIGEYDQAIATLQQASLLVKSFLSSARKCWLDSEANGCESVESEKLPFLLEMAAIEYQLGTFYSRINLNDMALLHLNYAYQLYVQVHGIGRFHIDVARTLDTMGKVYLSTLNFDCALQCHTQALHMKFHLLSRDTTRVSQYTTSSPLSQSSLVSTLTNIAIIYEAIKDWKAATCTYHMIDATLQ
jgi:tetratricopeptide (TPR) repeat protein